ncbi:MAG: SDR family NAD(P)-dependent oxidoreductase [Pseudomonadota bacterium]
MKALVTGAASGLGKALVERLATDGFEIVAVDRDPVEEGDKVTALTADLADRAAVDRLLTELKALGPFDHVIHNAGVSATGPFETIPEAAMSRLFTVNCETPLVMTSAMLQAGYLAPGAHIIFISSISHFTGYPGASCYGASKDVLAVYAKSIRRDLRRKDLNVMTVYPGPVRTPHAARHAPPDADAAKRMDPADLADRIVRAAAKRRSVIYPGLPAKSAFVIGRLMPRGMTRLMRRMIFEKLDRTVY